MRIGAIIPDRGDRPLFTAQCMRMLDRQTRIPDVVLLANDPPVSAPDLTLRVRQGFERLSPECDLVFVIENDDYYDEDYIKIMSYLWEELGCPDLIGIGHTTYYHLGKRAYRTWRHRHSSLFCTAISGNAGVTWPPDHHVFLDLWLWSRLKGKLIDADLAIGMKHGQGLCGGGGHNTMRYEHRDADMQWLQGMVDEESFDFYSKLKL